MLRDLSGGAFWTTLSTLINRVAAILVALPVARMIGKAEFGLFNLVATTLMVFATFGATGFGALANRYCAELRSTDPQRLGRILAMSVVTVVVIGGGSFVAMLFLADWTAREICLQPEIGPLLQLAAVAILGLAVNGLNRGILGGLRAFRVQTIFNSIGAVTAPLFIGIGCYLSGLNGAIAGLAASHLANGLLSAYYTIKALRQFHIPIRIRGWTQELALLPTFWLPAMLGSLVVTPATFAMQSLLSRQPGGEEMLGAAGAGDRFRIALGIVPMALNQVVLTLLSEKRSDAERSSYVSLYDLHLRLIVVIVLPLAAAGAAASKPIMALFGPEFVPNWQVLTIMAATGFVIMATSTVGQLLTSADRMWLAFITNAGWMGLLLGLGWFWIPQHGENGYAMSYLVSHTVHAVLSFAVCRWMLDIRLETATLALLFFSPIAFLLAYFGADALGVYPGIGVGLIAFAVTFAICWRFGMHAEEKTLILAMAKSLPGRIRRKRAGAAT